MPAEEYDMTADQQITPQQKAEQFHNFLLINSKSGDLAGKQMVNGSPEIISFLHGQVLSHFYFVDLYCESQRKDGFKRANQLCSEGLNVRMIICGGDGTIQWVLEEAVQNKINLNKIVFGVLPVGSGNDFAKSIGWKKVHFSGKLSQLKKLSLEFSKMKVTFYDVWQCEINCQDTGTITQIKNGQQIILPSKKLTRNFTNYFGIGTDARITYFTQKVRPLDAKAVIKHSLYVLVGFFSYFTDWKRIHLGNQICIKQKVQQPKQPKQSQQIELLNNQENLDEQIYENIPTIGDDRCFIFLNSTISMQIKNIWDTPYQSQETNQQKKQFNQDDQNSSLFNCQTRKKKQFYEQKVDDGKIQVISYRNQFSLGLETWFHMAKKVTQGKGPYKINFKGQNSNETNYVQINGEAYKFNGLEQIIIRPSPNFPNSKIKVLAFNEQ